MSRISKWVSFAAVVVGVASGTVAFGKVPPAEHLLPKSTKGFITVASIDHLRDTFNATQLGQLVQDPAMQPFVESFQHQIESTWTQTHERLGITWDDLRDVPSGEVGLGMILINEKEASTAIVADVTDHLDQAQAMLAKISGNLTSQKAKVSKRNIYGTTMTVLDVPKRKEQPAHQVAFVIKDGLLAIADNAKVVEAILVRQADGEVRSDSLSAVPAFSAVERRCQLSAGELQPEARWFIDPFGYADLLRVMNAGDKPRAKGTDLLKILKHQGFTAISGVGGFVNFSVAQYEMLHRTFIYAPGYENGSKERFQLAARMLDLPNGGDFTPPAWVPRDVASCISVNINVKNAFEMSKSLVNEFVGDEVFDDVLDSMLKDPNGPRIDLRKDLVAYLGNRVTVVSDLQLPITPKSERVLVGIEVTNADRVTATIAKMMGSDPDVRKREIHGYVVWEVIDKEAEMPKITIENSHIPALGPVDEPKDEEKSILPNSAITVAFGQLFVATHIDILAKVLADDPANGKLYDSPDYLRVATELANLQMPVQSIQAFTRTDDAYRGTYELIKAGRMPESEAVLGKILNAIIGENKDGMIRSQKIDGSKLPDYELVRRFLGPAGMMLSTEETGWFMAGFTLPKHSPAPELVTARKDATVELENDAAMQVVDEVRTSDVDTLIDNAETQVEPEHDEVIEDASAAASTLLLFDEASVHEDAEAVDIE